MRIALCLVLLAACLRGQQRAEREALYREFRDPPHEYSLMPYWFWNGTLTAEDTRRQIDAMISQGVYSAIAMPWDGMRPRYLSEDYWRELGTALDYAASRGFTLNLG